MKLILIFALVGLTSQLAKADGPDPAHTTVMPSIDVSNQPVDKVLEFMRSSLPWFHYVVFRQAGAPKDEPKLPEMALDGVTVEQFLKLMTDEYPTIISIKKVDGDKTPLYEINIADPNKLPWKATEVGRAASASEPVMKVFSLSDIVSHMNGANDPKKATDDILSLVQAALDASGGDPKNPPVLKVHPATQTLIFKGTPDKLAVLSQVLDTLRPDDSEEIAKVKSQLSAVELKLADRIADRQRALDELDRFVVEKRMLEAKLLESQSEVGRLQGQLKVTTQPSK